MGNLIESLTQLQGYCIIYIGHLCENFIFFTFSPQRQILNHSIEMDFWNKE